MVVVEFARCTFTAQCPRCREDVEWTTKPTVTDKTQRLWIRFDGCGCVPKEGYS